MIEALVTAFELANIEMLFVSMPEAIVKNVSTALLRRWNCQREDVVGKALMKFGSGSLSARFVQDVSGETALKIIEVSYAPPLGTQIKSNFRTQEWNEDGTQNRVFPVMAGFTSATLPRSAARVDRLVRHFAF